VGWVKTIYQNRLTELTIEALAWESKNL